jgi:hypothetical protein
MIDLENMPAPTAEQIAQARENAINAERPAAAGYGTDKAIFGYGFNSSSQRVSMTNLVSNTGIVATDTAGVGTARFLLAAAGYSLS